MKTGYIRTGVPLSRLGYKDSHLREEWIRHSCFITPLRFSISKEKLSIKHEFCVQTQNYVHV